jgi:cold shock CspA family protein
MDMIGTVTSWVAHRKFGFLAVEGQVASVFCHVSALERSADDPAPPAAGDVVEFTLADEGRGPRAREARIVKRAAPAPQP